MYFILLLDNIVYEQKNKKQKKIPLSLFSVVLVNNHHQLKITQVQKAVAVLKKVCRLLIEHGGNPRFQAVAS